MLKRITRTLALLALVLVAVIPASAGARTYTNRSAPEGAPLAIAPVAQPATSAGFDWGAAGLGAGGVLLVLSIGAAGGVAGRRHRSSRTMTA
jgi:hypothetical protein